MNDAGIPFGPDSDLFRAFQRIWREVVDEELTYEKAKQYGPAILALVGAVARWKRSEQRRRT